MAIVAALVYFLLSSSAFSAKAIGIPAASTTTRPRKLVAKLIHRDSVLHPCYNPNETISDRAERAIRGSNSRLAYLQAKMKEATFSEDIQTVEDDIRASVIPDEGTIFLANFSIGEPPVVQLVGVDTGSSLLWIQCLPCTNCLHRPAPIFDPAKSKTFANLSCNSTLCNNLKRCQCDQFNHASFKIEYEDGSNTNGTIAREQLVFETSDEGIVILPNVTFGCGHNIQTRQSGGNWTGVMGLGTGIASLARQFGSKFSYCLGNISDPFYNYNHLILGEGAELEGYSTPFETFDGHYYVTLEGISIGEKKLEIDPDVFARTSDGGGVLIDSGSTDTTLAYEAFTSLAYEISSFMDGILTRSRDEDRRWELCYNGVVTRDLVGFPVVTFHFAGGAELVLDPESLFHQRTEDRFCMAVDPDSLGNDYVVTPTNIIGVMAQQNYNVAYDLDKKLIYFQRIDCELLID